MYFLAAKADVASSLNIIYLVYLLFLLGANFESTATVFTSSKHFVI